MKKKGSELQEFGSLLDKTLNAKTKIQTHWVKVKTVNWEEKTMICTGVKDELDFNDVLLGLGSVNRKPKLDSLCLIGIILNQDASAFLIEASEIEAYELIDSTGFKLELNEGLMTINGSNYSGLVKAPELRTQVDKNTKIIEMIQNVFNSWTVIPEDGGAALKALVSQFTGLQRADLSDIENNTVKHGNGN
jgi:3-dehydroquinate synthase class II